jgi:hypothetical protein
MAKKTKKKKIGAAGASSVKPLATKPSAPKAHAPRDVEAAEDEFEDDAVPGRPVGAEPSAEPEDKYWWTPHAVLGVLILLGILGFFGFFNKWLGFLAADKGEPASTSAPTAPAPAPKPATAAVPAKTAMPPRNTAAPLDTTQYGAKHILIAWKGAMRAAPSVSRTKDEAAKIASNVAKAAKATVKSKKREEEWKILVEQNTDDPTNKTKAGDLGTFSPHGYDPKFVEGLKKTEVGAVSDPVESAFGYHIIWRTK